MRESGITLPAIRTRHLRWFHRYARWYLRRHFHGLHLLRLASLDTVAGYPLLVCLNHPSWWDPLVALELTQRFFPQRRHYAPIAAAGLAKYGFFEKLGFFGIEPATRVGAQRFLEIGQAALAHSDAALWITPQGEFTDVRNPARLAGGAGHLAHRLPRFAMLPVALEYSFWSEKYPEAFAAIGRPVLSENGQEQSSSSWTSGFSRALQNTQDALAESVRRRDPASFEPLLAGAAGVGGVYDVWRRSKARLQGKPWQPEHGSR